MYIKEIGVKILGICLVELVIMCEMNIYNNLI
jgi:hypothetical protein